MSRGADPAIPSEKQLEKWLATIREISRSLDRYTVTLSRKGRMRRLKPRRGGRNISTLIAQLATERQLRLSAASAEDIATHATRARRLALLQAAVSAIAATLADTVMMSETKAWWATTALYTALRGMARHDGSLTMDLEPARKFFALGRRKPKTPPK